MISPGIKYFVEKIVNESDTASALGSGLLRVFSTPSMIALMENCCHLSIGPNLLEGEDTVGIEISVKHLKATSVGKKVVAFSELIDIDKKILTFNVKVFENEVLIGEGVHKRAIINVEKFLSKLS